MDFSKFNQRIDYDHTNYIGIKQGLPKNLKTTNSLAW